MFQNALSHLRAASLPTISSTERDIRCTAAEAELVKVFCENSPKNCLTDQQQVQLELIWGEIVLLQGHNDIALRILEETADRVQLMVERGEQIQRLTDTLESLQWDAANQGLRHEILQQRQKLVTEGSCAHPSDHAVVLLRIGHVHRLQKNWHTALETYEYLWQCYMKESLLPPFQEQEVFTSVAEAAYHLGWYDRAVMFGEAIVQMNRYHPWSHKYVALSHLAMGNADKARQVAAQGVMYETPWDEVHRTKVRRWYRETFGQRSG